MLRSMGKFQVERAVNERVEMREGSQIETLESAGYVEFSGTGDAAVGSFHCAECGYGVTVQRTLPLCPMCGGTAWEQTSWNPFRGRTGPFL
jgi:rubrerythrin